MNETNTAAISGGIRGLGNVTGEVSGLADDWIAQNGIESSQQTNLHQSLLDDHMDLHDEIESNDISPKNGVNKLKIVSTK